MPDEQHPLQPQTITTNNPSCTTPPDLSPTINITNADFLHAIFGHNLWFAHVTGFPDDPSAIAPERRGACWAGAHFTADELAAGQNQYFCISIFRHVDGRAVRRKANFMACYCIVADDVKDKVPEAQAARLPPPSWRLETSAGNEQWGWILWGPETDRARVENLLDGLVKLGLAPDGMDPGMKGVTRYVRLPEGWNTKQKCRADGDERGWRCRMMEWAPERRYGLEALAGPFGVDLNARRSDDVEVAGASWDDHPVLQAVRVLDEKGDGEYLIECPWIEEHTDGDSSGTILYTKADGSIGFKCHHGHCQDRTGRDLLEKLELRGTLDVWRLLKHVESGAASGAATEGGGETPAASGVAPGAATEGRVERANLVYLVELDRFYNFKEDVFTTRNQMDAMYPPMEQQPPFCKRFFQDAMPGTHQFASPTYLPGREWRVFDGGCWRYNTWRSSGLVPEPGKVEPWSWLLEHLLPNAEERKVLVQWMAWTLRHPDRKCNWAPLVAGTPGAGKDLAFKPLFEAAGYDNVAEISAEELTEQWTDWLGNARYVVFQEIHAAIGTASVYNRLKPMCAAPPERLRVNVKGLKQWTVPNIVQAVAFSNCRKPLHLDKDDRRWGVFDCWVKQLNTEQIRRVLEFYESGGYARVAWHLLNEVDLAGFDPHRAPSTAAKQQLQMLSESVEKEDLAEVLEHRTVITMREVTNVVGGPGARNRRLPPMMRELGWWLRGQVKVHGKKKRLWVHGSVPESTENAELAARWVRESGSPVIVPISGAGEDISFL